jgi:hypothetical protein
MRTPKEVVPPRRDLILQSKLTLMIAVEDPDLLEVAATTVAAMAGGLKSPLVVERSARTMVRLEILSM